ncbi:hypothetical protein QQS19_32780, partial [Pseudomonas aeruginosa]|uniref:hypothetical protein n=1 Tax=Pseudomonas aeruginosa TaxID=287 RepID=UPI002B23D424
MGSCAAPSAKGDDKFITTDYLQQCRNPHGCWDAFLERGLFQTFLSLAYDFFRILRFPHGDMSHE